MQRFPSVRPSLLCLVCGSSVSPTIQQTWGTCWCQSRPPLLSLSLCLICTFIFLVFFRFVVLHLTVSHTICLLSLSFCLLQCATEIFALKSTDELLLTLTRLLCCAWEVAKAFRPVAKQLLKHSWWLLGRCWPVAKVLLVVSSYWILPTKATKINRWIYTHTYFTSRLYSIIRFVFRIHI